MKLSIATTDVFFVLFWFVVFFLFSFGPHLYDNEKLHIFAKITPLLFYSMRPLVNPLYLVVLAVCDTHRLKSSNHTFHCYIVGGKGWG